MPASVPIIERAFQLARTGQFERLRQIVQRLEADGYLDAQEHLTDWPLLRRQLREALRAAAGEVERV